MLIYKAEDIICCFNYCASFKKLREIQLCSFLSASRIQMQRIASFSDTVTVQRQALTE